MKRTLILNPTENILMNSAYDYSEIEGLYISDDRRDIDSKIIFAGRERYIDFMNKYKKKWCALINASDIDFRYLSGLHAHIISFMSIGDIGDKVLLLPEEAGGHYSTKKILTRLGYKVVEMQSDKQHFCVDKEKTMDLIYKHKPKFAFVDRSEGLYYEDFSWISTCGIPYCIFDASQYLSQIIGNEYISPFNMGFNLMISTMHKNYPGPQKAFLATKTNDIFWKKLKRGSSTYISNAHPKDMFLAMSSIKSKQQIKEYSSTMIDISMNLEMELDNYGVNVIRKDSNLFPTQHIWIKFDSKEKCYKTYTALEKIGILTNYRLLPYDLGYGIRLGVGAAIQSGLRNSEIKELAQIISICYKSGYSTKLERRCSDFIDRIAFNGKMI